MAAPKAPGTIASAQRLEDLCRPPVTYMGTPLSWNLQDAKAAVLGLPFDCGLGERVGARLGPNAIRMASRMLDRAWPPRYGPESFETLGLIDCGDAAVILGDIQASYEVIESALDLILAAGVFPLTYGGDGAVSLPQLRAAARHHGPLALLHFDAHSDAYKVRAQRPYDNATTFTHAASEGLLDLERAYHIGLRGPSSQADVVESARAMGYQVISMSDLRAEGLEAVTERLVEELGDQPVYLCWDMDVFDPSVAPGVCDPTWGGLSAAEGFEILEKLSQLQIVAIDINTVSPPHDPAGMTAFLAAQVGLLALLGQSARL